MNQASGGSGGRFVKQYGNIELDNYIHDTIMFLVNLLMGLEEDYLELTKVTMELCKRGNTKPLKKVTSGDSVEERVLAFVWQHPAIFAVKDKKIGLKRMSADIDDQLEAQLGERTVDFIVFRCHQYGPCQILISKLFGNLHQAASDIRHHFSQYALFYAFLQKREDIFVQIDENYIALRSVYEDSLLKNRPLLKCDEYLIDGRVLNCTKLVTDFEYGRKIIDFVLQTQKVVAIDCEGVNLGASNGYITLVQMAFVNQSLPTFSIEDVASFTEIYIFDIQADRRLLLVCLKKLLQSDQVIKIFQGCSSDSTALRNKYDITLNYVFDTVIAHKYLHEGVKSDLYYLYELYVGEVTNRMKKDIKKQYISNPRLWTTRPLTQPLIYYAAFDVYALIRIYFAMLPQLSQNGYESILRRSNGVAYSAANRSNALEEPFTNGSSPSDSRDEELNAVKSEFQHKPADIQDPSNHYYKINWNTHGSSRGRGGYFYNFNNSLYHNPRRQGYGDSYYQPRDNMYQELNHQSSYFRFQLPRHHYQYQYPPQPQKPYAQNTYWRPARGSSNERSPPRWKDDERKRHEWANSNNHYTNNSTRFPRSNDGHYYERDDSREASSFRRNDSYLNNERKANYSTHQHQNASNYQSTRQPNRTYNSNRPWRSKKYDNNNTNFGH